MTAAPASELPGDVGPSGRPVWALTGEQMLAELDALHVEACRTENRRLALLAGLEQIGHAKEIGARSTAELIALRHRLDYQQVHRDLKLARALPKYPIVQQGLDNGPHTGPFDPASDDPASDGAASDGAASDGATPGDVDADGATGQADADAGGARDVGRLGLHVRQAEAIVTALERLPATVPVDNIEVAEFEMVAAARTSSPADLRRLGRWVVERLDTDGREPPEDAARAKERLWLSRNFTGDGIRFRGFLANENAELFQALIDACSKPRKATITDPDGPDGTPGKTRTVLDPRTKTQRQADALIQILHTAAATSRIFTSSTSTSTSTSPGTSPGTGTGTGTGDADLGDLGDIGIPAHGGIRPHIMVTIGLYDLIQAGRQQTGDLLFGDRLSASAVRMLACDANVIPIVLGTNSEPLDVGQAFRSVTPAIRLALIARDKGCIIPGCDAPPGWCDAHHLEHWADGGETSVDNTVLGCKPHHRQIHQGIWQVEIINGAVRVTGPHYKPPKTRAKPRPAPTERPPP